MKNLQFLLFLPLALLGLGCGHSHEGHESHSGTEGVAVQLNNGQKWVANPETIEGIAKMQALVDTYLSSGDTNVQALGVSLETEFSDIFAKCTMEGEAHEQLHNYLLPLKDHLQKLDEHTGAEAVQEIKAYLGTFKEYFQ